MTCPDFRLGQFLCNYVFGHHTDIFFQEDSLTENILNKHLYEINKKEGKNG